MLHWKKQHIQTNFYVATCTFKDTTRNVWIVEIAIPKKMKLWVIGLWWLEGELSCSFESWISYLLLLLLLAEMEFGMAQMVFNGMAQDGFCVELVYWTVFSNWYGKLLPLRDPSPTAWEGEDWWLELECWCKGLEQGAANDRFIVNEFASFLQVRLQKWLINISQMDWKINESTNIKR